GGDADADGGHGDVVAREGRDQVEVILGTPVRVPVGEQDDVTDGTIGLDEITSRDVERVLEVGTAAVTQGPDAHRERVATVGDGAQRTQLVRLRVERDGADEVV